MKQTNHTSSSVGGLPALGALLLLAPLLFLSSGNGGVAVVVDAFSPINSQKTTRYARYASSNNNLLQKNQNLLRAIRLPSDILEGPNKNNNSNKSSSQKEPSDMPNNNNNNNNNKKDKEPPNKKSNDKKDDKSKIKHSHSTTDDDLLVEHPEALDTSFFVWLFPPTLMGLAFQFYTQIQHGFHYFMDTASGHTWANVDGGNYMSEIVKPVLNGPVTLSISILFGTLCSMTIQTLYKRQNNLHQCLISTVEEIRELQWLVEGFPEPYKSTSHSLLATFLTESFQDFQRNQVTPESLRSEEMTKLLVLLNELSKQRDVCPDIIVCEAYGCVHRLKDRRAEFMSAFQTVFSSAHYVVIGLLAATLLFVFLLETDNDTMQFLLDFQLSICWSMLIGSYSMLATVLYDLNTPFSGIFTTMKGVQFVGMEQATKVYEDVQEETDMDDEDYQLWMLHQQQKNEILEQQEKTNRVVVEKQQQLKQQQDNGESKPVVNGESKPVANGKEQSH